MKISSPFLVLVGALVAISPASAFANGAGYNGPDLAPQSIPVVVDRAIPSDAPRKAVEACLYGDSKKLDKRSLGEQLFATIYGFYPDRVETVLPTTSRQFAHVFIGNPPLELKSKGKKKGSSIKWELGLRDNTANDVSYPDQSKRDQHNSLAINFRVDPLDEKSVVTLSTVYTYQLPYFQVGESYRECSYDEWGRELACTPFMINSVSLIIPPEVTQGMRFRNTRTGKDTPLYYNFSDLAECMQREIQSAIE